jgi:hypothetical protein
MSFARHDLASRGDRAWLGALYRPIRIHDAASAAFGLLKNVSAPGRLVLVAGLAAEQRHRLAGEGDEGGLARRV